MQKTFVLYLSPVPSLDSSQVHLRLPISHNFVFSIKTKKFSNTSTSISAIYLLLGGRPAAEMWLTYQEPLPWKRNSTPRRHLCIAPQLGLWAPDPFPSMTKRWLAWSCRSCADSNRCCAIPSAEVQTCAVDTILPHLPLTSGSHRISPPLSYNGPQGLRRKFN